MLSTTETFGDTSTVGSAETTGFFDDNDTVDLPVPADFLADFSDGADTLVPPRENGIVQVV